MNVIATYYLETDDVAAGADALAGEQSTGTWVRVGFETDALMKRHRAKVLEVDGNIVKVAFPAENFGPVVPMLLTTVAGNLFEMGDFRNVKLLDLEFPEDFVREFKGPEFGIEGTKNALGVKGRPLVG
ncbi:MAG: hypothetical protein V3V36_01090, partial [Candidatus Hydrothermarchaeaceae archaeon]